MQIDALTKEGCEKIFQEKASCAQRDRPELKAALSYMREGDILVIWKLDRLARSMKQLIETVEDFEARGIGLKSLQDEGTRDLIKAVEIIRADHPVVVGSTKSCPGLSPDSSRNFTIS